MLKETFSGMALLASLAAPGPDSPEEYFFRPYVPLANAMLTATVKPLPFKVELGYCLEAQAHMVATVWLVKTADMHNRLAKRGVLPPSGPTVMPLAAASRGPEWELFLAWQDEFHGRCQTLLAEADKLPAAVIHQTSMAALVGNNGLMGRGIRVQGEMGRRLLSSGKKLSAEDCQVGESLSRNTFLHLAGEPDSPAPADFVKNGEVFRRALASACPDGPHSSEGQTKSHAKASLRAVLKP